ncbi:Mobile element protein [Rhodovulum sp. P5]|nr:Mobile element protein [Rhodovulum sp. P5]
MRSEPHRLVFIDETAVTTKMTRLRGRSARGTRLEADAPFGHWRAQTFIAGLRIDELSAPWVLDGPMNRAAFDIYIETQLAPTLQPGDVVIADNLSSHKSAHVQEILKSQGSWLLFLPPYSPDLNPVWMAPAWQGVCELPAAGRLRPCIRRPVAANLLRAMMNFRVG